MGASHAASSSPQTRSPSHSLPHAECLHGVAGALGHTPDEEEHVGRLQAGAGAAGAGQRGHKLPALLHGIVALHGGQRGWLVTCQTECKRTQDITRT